MPDFYENSVKVAQDSKEESRESAVRGEKILQNYRVKR